MGSGMSGEGDESSDHKRAIPLEVLQEIHNTTGLPHFQFMKMGPGREFYDVVIVKAAFNLEPGIAKLADKPAQINYADEFWDDDDPELSSLKVVGDTVLYKPYADVFVTGHVWHYGAKPTTSWNGLLRVKRDDIILIDKSLRFTGARNWKHDSGDTWSLSKPQFATVVPLRYELAYGGYWINPKEKNPDFAQVAFGGNPSGTGYFGVSHNKKQQYTGVQIESTGDSLTKSNAKNTAGWGPIARFWNPRVDRQGTYNDAWFDDFNDNEFADYPKDFQFSYFNSAPADQMISLLRGDERIGLAGVFPEKDAINAQLPGWHIKAQGLDEDGELFVGLLNCDTVHVDLDARVLNVTWRLNLKHSKKIPTLLLELID